MRMIHWLQGVKEASRRETDERHRSITLLATRDAFYVVLFLLLGYFLLKILPFAAGGVENFADRASEVMALAALPIALLVWGLSAYARGFRPEPGRFVLSAIVVLVTSLVVNGIMLGQVLKFL